MCGVVGCRRESGGDNDGVRFAKRILYCRMEGTGGESIYFLKNGPALSSRGGRGFRKDRRWTYPPSGRHLRTSQFIPLQGEPIARTVWNVFGLAHRG